LTNSSQQSLAQAPLLPLLYADDQNYGWREGMGAITLALLANVTLPDGPVVEVGCGGGKLLVDLQQRYPERMVVGADLHPLALAHAHTLLYPSITLAQASLPHLPWQENQIALLLALDVFDQQGVELDAALAESYRLLRSDGALVMRVSAHPSLYGAHDLAFHTGRRYTHSEVQKALLQAGFAVQRLTYANTILSLPVAAMRLAERWGVLPWHPATYQQTYLHHAAAWLLRQEAGRLYHADLPWGLSLCAVARKP
jgi:ubiquinone/menaquinone biosynthesis C-methylase UbiE